MGKPLAAVAHGATRDPLHLAELPAMPDEPIDSSDITEVSDEA